MQSLFKTNQLHKVDQIGFLFEIMRFTTVLHVFFALAFGFGAAVGCHVLLLVPFWIGGALGVGIYAVIWLLIRNDPIDQ